MHSDLQRHPKNLLVISDTALQYTDSGVKAFSPVVKELTYLLEEFDEITWIGFERIVYALYCQHGPLTDKWPKDLKEKLEL